METRAIRVGSAILSFQACLAGAAADDGTIFKVMTEKCAAELGTYCKSVAISDARKALCAYAHEDKLSTQCGVAVYDPIVAMEVSLAALGAYAKTCREDLLKFCGTTKWGEGRLYACLVANKPALKNGCAAVLDSAKPELQRLGVAK